MTKLNLSVRAGFALLCLVWGSIWLAIHVMVGRVPPLRSAGLQFGVAALLLLPFIFFKRLPLPRGRQLGMALLLSVTMLALPYALAFWAQTRLPSGVSAVLYAALPLVAALYSSWLENKSLPQAALYGLVAGVGGIALVVSSALAVSVEQVAAVAAMLVAVCFSGASSVHAKRELTEAHPLVATALQMLGASAALLLASAVMEHGQPSDWNRDSVLALLFLGVFGNALMFPLYFWLLGRLEAYQVGTVQWFEPLVAIAEGALLLHEYPTARMLAGTAFVLASAVCVLRPSKTVDGEVTLKLTREPE